MLGKFLDFEFVKNVITKDKGDIGLTQIIADLTEKDVKIALPLSEHLPFDLIAISPEGGLTKSSFGVNFAKDFFGPYGPMEE